MDEFDEDLEFNMKRTFEKKIKTGTNAGKLKGNQLKLRKKMSELDIDIKDISMRTNRFVMGDDDASKKRDNRWIEDYSLDQEQIELIKESFASFDLNEEGLIMVEQFGNVLRYMGQTPTETEIADLIKTIDAEAKGMISLEEFVRVIGKRGLKDESTLKKELEEALQVFAKDKEKGIITPSDLEEALCTLGETMEDYEAKELLKLGITDNQGDITAYDLVAAMCGKI